MVGKLTTVLIKKEAETYRAQGLHKEAIALYEKLVAGTPNIDPDLKTAIQSEVEGITREMRTFDASRDMPLSTEEILQIKEGWGPEASQTDIMICAQALYHVGAYEDALIEYHRLLQSGCDSNRLTGAISQCLAKAYPPDQLPHAVDALVAGVCFSPKQAVAFQLRLAENLAAQTDKTQALVYCGHLVQDPDLPAPAKTRLKQMLAKLRTDRDEDEDETPEEEAGPSGIPDAPWIERFRRFMTGKFFGRGGTS